MGTLIYGGGNIMKINPTDSSLGFLQWNPTNHTVYQALSAKNKLPDNIDKSQIRVEPSTTYYDSTSGLNELVLYNSKGQVTSSNYSTNYLPNSDVLGDAQQSILQDIDPSLPIYKPLTIQIPQGGELLTTYEQQYEAVNAEDENLKNIYETALHQYDGNATPIADSMLLYLETLQKNANSQNVGSVATNDLDSVPGGDGNYLAESVVAYDKAKTEIEQTYSTDSIEERAKEQSIEDITTYTKQQQTAKMAELQKLNLDYAYETGINISKQTSALNTFFNGSDKFNDPNAQAIGSFLVSTEKQLFSLYDQFKQKNSVNYSSDSVQDIAKQFQAYSAKSITTTVNISNTPFTYQDIVSSGEVLSVASVGSSDFYSTIGQFHAALGASEVSYVAKHYMTAAAGQLLYQKYNEHLKYQESTADTTVGSQEYDVAGYSEMKSLNTDSAESFKKSFENVLQYAFGNGNAEGYSVELKNIFDKFANQFLN